MTNNDQDDLPAVDADVVSLPGPEASNDQSSEGLKARRRKVAAKGNADMAALSPKSELQSGLRAKSGLRSGAEEATVGDFADHRSPPPPPRASSAKIPSRIGEMLADRYRLEKLIAKGGMGRVYLATQLPLERKVAIKLLLSKGFDDEFRQRFFLEASTCARLVHRHIVTVHDYGEAENGELFMAMEYLDGHPLSKVIAREVRLESDRACQIALQTCRALRTAHKSGIVHRDLKPGNVMLLTDDEQESVDFVKVLDFGLVKAFDTGGAEPPVDLTRSGTWLGSPRYMAPEQIRCQDVDPRTDIYSLGVILFHMIAGRPPFVGANSVEILEQHLRDPVPSIREVVGQINYEPELEEIIRTCMAKSPSDRYQSMDALIRDLKAVYRISTGVSIHTESSLPMFHELGRDGESQIGARSHLGSTSGSAIAPAAPAVGPAPDLGPTISGTALPSAAPPAPPVVAAPVLTPFGVTKPQPTPAPEPESQWPTPPSAGQESSSKKYVLLLLVLLVVLVGGFVVTRLVKPKEAAVDVAVAQVQLTIQSTPAGAEVLGADGSVLGSTPYVDTLGASAHGSTRRYTLRHVGYADRQVIADLNSENVTVQAELRKLPGSEPEAPAAREVSAVTDVELTRTEPRREASSPGRKASRRPSRPRRESGRRGTETRPEPVSPAAATATSRSVEVKAVPPAATVVDPQPTRAPNVDDAVPSILVDEGEATTVSDSLVPVVD